MGRSRSPSRAEGGVSKKNRQFRRKRADEDDAKPSAGSSQRAQQLAALEEQVLVAVQEAVEKKVAEAVASEDFQKRVMARLKEERAKLEAAVTQQLDEERVVLLQKKRKEQEEAKRQQEELDRILEENRRKVAEAQQRAAQAMDAVAGPTADSEDSTEDVQQGDWQPGEEEGEEEFDIRAAIQELMGGMDDDEGLDEEQMLQMLQQSQGQQGFAEDVDFDDLELNEELYKELGMSPQEVKEQQEWVRAQHTDPEGLDLTFDELSSVTEDTPPELRDAVTRSDSWGPEAVVLAGFPPEEHGIVRGVLDSAGGQPIKVLPVTREMLYGTVEEAVWQSERDWSAPREAQDVAREAGGVWGAERTILYSGLSIKTQATILELLEGIGLGPIAVTMAFPSDATRRLGDMLADAVQRDRKRRREEARMAAEMAARRASRSAGPAAQQAASGSTATQAMEGLPPDLAARMVDDLPDAEAFVRMAEQKKAAAAGAAGVPTDSAPAQPEPNQPTAPSPPTASTSSEPVNPILSALLTPQAPGTQQHTAQQPSPPARPPQTPTTPPSVAQPTAEAANGASTIADQSSTASQPSSQPGSSQQPPGDSWLQFENPLDDLLGTLDAAAATAATTATAPADSPAAQASPDVPASASPSARQAQPPGSSSAAQALPLTGSGGVLNEIQEALKKGTSPDDLKKMIDAAFAQMSAASTAVAPPAVEPPAAPGPAVAPASSAEPQSAVTPPATGATAAAVEESPAAPGTQDMRARARALIEKSKAAAKARRQQSPAPPASPPSKPYGPEPPPPGGVMSEKDKLKGMLDLRPEALRMLEGRNVKFVDLSKLPKKYREQMAEQQKAKAAALRAQAEVAAAATEAAAAQPGAVQGAPGQAVVGDDGGRGAGSGGARIDDSLTALDDLIETAAAGFGSQHAADTQGGPTDGRRSPKEQAAQQAQHTQQAAKQATVESKEAEVVADGDEEMQEVDALAWRRSMMQRVAAEEQLSQLSEEQQAELSRVLSGKTARLLGRQGRLRQKAQQQAVGSVDDDEEDPQETAGSDPAGVLSSAASTAPPAAADSAPGPAATGAQGQAQSVEGQPPFAAPRAAAREISYEQLSELVKAAQESGLDTERLMAEAMAMGMTIRPELAAQVGVALPPDSLVSAVRQQILAQVAEEEREEEERQRQRAQARRAARAGGAGVTKTVSGPTQDKPGLPKKRPGRPLGGLRPVGTGGRLRDLSVDIDEDGVVDSAGGFDGALFEDGRGGYARLNGDGVVDVEALDLGGVSGGGSRSASGRSDGEPRIVVEKVGSQRDGRSGGQQHGAGQQQVFKGFGQQQSRAWGAGLGRGRKEQRHAAVGSGWPSATRDRSGVGGREQAQAAQHTAPAAQPQPGTISRAQLAAVAARTGQTVEQLIADARARGVVIPDE